MAIRGLLVGICLLVIVTLYNTDLLRGIVRSRHAVAQGAIARSARRRTLAEEEAAGEDVCQFFKRGFGKEQDELHWGSGNVCTIPDGAKWSGRAAARCRDCISPGVNLCEAPPRLLVHQYLNRLDPEDWRGNLLSMQAYLLTQDLDRTLLVLWADDPAAIVNNDTLPFFSAFVQHIQIRVFHFPAEVAGTPLEGDSYFGSEAAIKASLPKERRMAVYSDLVRYLLLHNYGGLWIDNDTLLMRDMYPVTLLIGYQFALRWLNAHVFYIRQRSALAARVLRTLKSMPLNHPRFKEDIIEKVCRPNGYYSVVDHEGFTDAWAFCALRLVLRHGNAGPDLDDVLFDQPLGWYDGQWPSGMPGCYKNDDPVNDTYFEEYIGKAMALHTRYPGHGGETALTPGSPFVRTKGILERFFARCAAPGCVPRAALPMLAYWKSDSDPSPVATTISVHAHAPAEGAAAAGAAPLQRGLAQIAGVGEELLQLRGPAQGSIAQTAGPGEELLQLRGPAQGSIAQTAGPGEELLQLPGPTQVPAQGSVVELSEYEEGLARLRSFAQSPVQELTGTAGLVAPFQRGVAPTAGLGGGLAPLQGPAPGPAQQVGAAQQGAQAPEQAQGKVAARSRFRGMPRTGEEEEGLGGNMTAALGEVLTQQEAGLFGSGSGHAVTSSGQGVEKPHDVFDVHDRMGQKDAPAELAALQGSSAAVPAAAGAAGEALAEEGELELAEDEDMRAIPAAAASDAAFDAAEVPVAAAGGSSIPVVPPKRGMQHKHHRARWMRSQAAGTLKRHWL